MTDILLEREKRVEYIEKLMEEYRLPCVVLRVNYPGTDKCNNITLKIFKYLSQEVRNKLYGLIKFAEEKITAEGPTLILIVQGIESRIKEEMILIEDNHFLGRLVDIDVYNPKDKSSLSRIGMGKEPRACFLCNNMAHICVRNKTHSLEEIVQFIEGKVKEFEDK